jgi:hypothetical protein
MKRLALLGLAFGVACGFANEPTTKQGVVTIDFSGTHTYTLSAVGGFPIPALGIRSGTLAINLDGLTTAHKLVWSESSSTSSIVQVGTWSGNKFAGTVPFATDSISGAIEVHDAYIVMHQASPITRDRTYDLR